MKKLLLFLTLFISTTVTKGEMVATSKDLDPSYDYQGYVKTGQRYHITAIKTNDKLYFNMTSEDGEELFFSWDLNDIEPITEGRI